MNGTGGTEGTGGIDGVDPGAVPTGTGCVECDELGGWWVHLRRCARCGHIGCCDNSPGQHATAHWRTTGHPVVQSFEPGERWYWNYATGALHKTGPELAPPGSRPVGQPSPGPADRLPADWRDRIHR
ncbi:UBP-type zinc finger domain-containing protein [Streptomyces bambusae]|uniref:UBP-type zinc finger domain-containing protein n=1 Tax=Streptomyces bambusae TaxID=1550616 RepID=UPI001CFDAAFC|nr:UBP-type zinc finger domain-containing protein [Streptomyces bambusae]MCB5168373.1 UBP-type zinc finger domain-containing protein [Streptomyces bambusae]